MRPAVCLSPAIIGPFTLLKYLQNASTQSDTAAGSDSATWAATHLETPLQEKQHKKRN